MYRFKVIKRLVKGGTLSVDTVTAFDFTISHGMLIFKSQSGETKAVYPKGVWRGVERI